MSMNISGIGSALNQVQSALQSAEAATSSAGASSSAPFSAPSLTAPDTGGSFSDIISSAIGEVESSSSAAAQSVQQFLAGSGEDLHTTILATQRAELEFQMFMQVRNKVVSAYQEIMKLQM
jgi:flagellar hook-basal body complex protein FliE